jgi:TRAP-type C4-dicarboxylate transport system substrate-binding protein
MIPLPHFMRTRPHKSKFLSAALVFALAASFVSVRAAAQDRPIELTVASSQPTTLAWVGAMHTLVVPELDRRLAARGSPHTIRWTEAYGGSLYKYGETLEGIQIGLTDMGWVGSLWELSKLPLQNVTFYAPFASDDFRLVVDIVNELHRTVPAMTEAWTAQNVKFLGASALDTYHLMTTFPVRNVDDLRGRKILAPGPSAAWLEGTGAVAVDGSLTTYYQQIQTGVADGVITILTGAAPNRLHEVAPHITLVGLGSQVTGALAINLDTWNRLPPDVRAVLEELGPEYSRGVADDIAKRYDASIARMRSEGAVVAEFPLAEKQKWLAAMPDIASSWIAATERRGQPAGVALRAYMSALRARGAQPLRDWDRAP